MLAEIENVHNLIYLLMEEHDKKLPFQSVFLPNYSLKWSQ